MNGTKTRTRLLGPGIVNRSDLKSILFSAFPGFSFKNCPGYLRPSDYKNNLRYFFMFYDLVFSTISRLIWKKSLYAADESQNKNDWCGVSESHSKRTIARKNIFDSPFEQASTGPDWRTSGNDENMWMMDHGLWRFFNVRCRRFFENGFFVRNKLKSLGERLRTRRKHYAGKRGCMYASSLRRTVVYQ